MNIKVLVPADRKCAASIDWDRAFSKATLSFGDKETPETDVEIMLTVSQLAELGCVVMEAEVAGNEARAKAKAEAARKETRTYHGGSC